MTDYKKDLIARGERHGMAKISDAQALEILAAKATTETSAAVAARFGISATQVRRIWTGERSVVTEVLK